MVNIGAQAAIRVMPQSAPNPDKMVPDDDYEDASVVPLSLDFLLDSDSEYVQALNSDVIKRVRDVVHTCRASSP